jgi:photosystem II stability/assembly factor-like uncharacterized protein
VDSKDADTVYVSNTSLYRSRDGGKTFTAIKGAPGGDDYHGLWIDPAEAQRMILGSDQGAVITLNGGETWSSWYNQPTAQFYHVATDNRFPYWVYGAQQDSGPAATPSRGNYRALNFHDWRPIEAGDENGYMAPDPVDPNVIYGGFVSRQDLRTEQNLPIPPTLMHSGEYRRTWTLPLVFSPKDPHVLYFSSQVLFRTADGGNSWQAISPDLTREDPGVPPNLDPATAADAPQGRRRGVIYTIAPSPLRAGLIWVGTDDGLIQVTRDEGKSWQNITPAEITSWSKVTHIEASHFDADTAYAAVDRHRLEDLKPYLYRTRDGGGTWQDVSRGIPDGSFLNCIREDPQKKGLLYACTENGVYVSSNGGDDWQSLQLNMPVVSVRDLVIHGDDLVIATHGRSFWILDDASPLRQFDSQAAASEAWLFRPQTALRVRPGSDQGTPQPLDEPQAENPPDGAILYYYLSEKAAAPVVLEILDAAGKTIRRYASDDKPIAVDPNSLEIPMYWVHAAEPLSAEAGMHRFVWDAHYVGPRGLRGGRRGAQGPWAPPGNYSVRLTVNGKPSTQPLILKMDPRVKTSAQDLARQFEISSQLTGAYADVTAANRQAEQLLAQIDAAGAKFAGDAPLTEALSSLSAKVRGALGAQREAFGSFGLAVPAGESSDLRSLVRAFTTLLSIVESADAAPSADVVGATARFSQVERAGLAHWKELTGKELPHVNELLRQKNAAPLALEAPRP